MANNDLPNPDYGKYRGLRALLLTRVSTPAQSHEAQERVIREKLIVPLALQLDEERHVIHDTYTGLEYRYRAALDDILRMAERREFDLLCLDVLDRGLGRKGVSREVFRGQLRELGIHILSTEPSDHSDDDSLEGQLMRLLKGYKAEEEVNDLVRRLKNGKRHKALGNKVIGNGIRPYGYKYVRDTKGKIETIEPNDDVVLVDRKGIAWTEVRVVVFVFRCAKRRIPLRQIVIRLNAIGIPVPYISLGRKRKPTGVQTEKPIWRVSALSRMLRNTTYSGRMIVNGQRKVKVPGVKSRRYVKTSPEEQITVPVPALVSIEVQEEALRKLRSNQQFAMRNNKQQVPALLRGGLAKCGNCGRKAITHRTHEKIKGGQKECMYYRCPAQADMALHKCPGCYIVAKTVDDAVWQAALEIINDPSKVDKALEKRRSKDPTESRRKEIKKKLAELQAERESLQTTLLRLIKERKLDRATEDRLASELKELEQLEYQYTSELLDDEKIRWEWEKAQQELEKLHRKCAIMQQRLKDPTYSPDYKDKRDMIEFFGITAILWENGHINPPDGKPQRCKIQAKFGDIVLQQLQWLKM